MKKSLVNLTASTLKVEEMFNVRGGDGDEKKETTSSSKNSTAQGLGEDIIL